MAYSNDVSAAVAVATTMMFIAVTIAPRWTEARPPPLMPHMDPVCVSANIPELLQIYYPRMIVLPSEQCCKDIKSASKKQVICLCDIFITHPVLDANITKAYFNQINTACGVLDKYPCDGGDASGGALNKIASAASVGLFGFVTSMLF